jgi:hypothetical protein
MAQITTGTDKLADKLAGGVPDRGIGLAYGEKQTIGGVDLIPVAFVSYGFGAVDDSDSLGTGGGGGGVAIPIGAYVDGPQGPRFAPNTIALVAVAIPVISALGLVIAKIVKAAR